MTVPAIEPIAIIGMSCRLPAGINSPDELWRFLLSGDDSAGAAPADRWSCDTRDFASKAIINTTASRGNFLSDVAGFDSEFFGISPREAEMMDPQQRIVLELSWEALEHAGIPPSDLAETDAGVYIGAGSDDYGRRMLSDITGIEAWMGVGSSLCGIANRVSYCLDLRGASMTVDTACSSALVAIHLACQALRTGEVPLAITGGVNVIADPALSVVLSSAGATSADGRCRSFDEGADGYGRAEGAAVFVLKRLCDAQRDENRILAVVRASGVCQDGRTAGIMAPSSAAQAHLLRKTYASSGLDPVDVGYVEAHGTGTPTGDPVELTAIAEVFGANRTREEPCLIGSSKSSLGHLEWAAGAVGLLKAVLAMEHDLIPGQANFSVPNSSIDWSASGLRVVDRTTPWPDGNSPRRAGISSYGYGGTLGHVVIEEYAARQARIDACLPEEAGTVCVVPFSAKSPEALRTSAKRFAEVLADADGAASVTDVAYTLGAHRQHHRFRAGILASDIAGLADQFAKLAAGDPPDSPESPENPESPESPEGLVIGACEVASQRGCVWVFSGHGSQWAGMGAELLDRSPSFTEIIDQLEPIFLDELGLSPREAIRTSEFDDTHLTQPMIFAMQVALANVWANEGLKPAAVIGHSVGEIAAAVVAGALRLDIAARLVCRRSIVLKRVVGHGAMALVEASPEAVYSLCAASEVVPAIHASPNSTVIAGDVQAVTGLCEQLAQQGVESMRVASDVAFHSPQMDPLLDELRCAIADLQCSQPSIPLYATALDDPRSHIARDEHYWANNLRNPVRLREAVEAAAADGYRLFLEISPHPVVANSIAETLAAGSVEQVTIAYTLRRDRPQHVTLLENKARLYVAGAHIDWSAMPARFVDLPTNPWRHREYWYAPTSGKRVAQNHDPRGHSLLGSRDEIPCARPMQVWGTFVDLDTRPYPGTHGVSGVEVVPASVLVNSLLGAAYPDGPAAHKSLRNIELQFPLTLDAARDLRVIAEDERISLASRSADQSDAAWITNVVAERVGRSSRMGNRLDIDRIRRRCATLLDDGHVEGQLKAIGIDGPPFPWRLHEISCNEDEVIALGCVDDPQPVAPLMDAALSLAITAIACAGRLKVVASIAEVEMAGDMPGDVVVYVRARDGLADVVDITIADRHGDVRCHLGGVHFRDLAEPGELVDTAELFYETVWRPIQFDRKSRRKRLAPTALVVVGDEALGRLVASVSDIPTTAVGRPEWLAGLDIGDRTAILVAPSRPDGEASVASAARDASWLLTATIQQLMSSGHSRPRVWGITRGVREATTIDAVADAAMWGVGRIAAVEHPELWGGIVDVECDPTAAGVARLIQVVVARPQDDVIAIRGSEITVARLAPAAVPVGAESAQCRSDGSYLVTGGLGALGLRVARSLVDRGARSIVLISRSGLVEPGEPLLGGVDEERINQQHHAIKEMRACGATVTVLRADIGDLSCVAALRATLDGLPPVRGVVHAAGVLDNRLLADVDEASLADVMHPKVAGAEVLACIAPPGSVDFFVMFSSVGQLLGVYGQTAYAAANSVLDAIARHRHSGGGTETSSFQWTSWRGLGMSTSSEVIDLELAARGTADITAEEAVQCLHDGLGRKVPEMAVFRLVDHADADMELPILSELAGAAAARTPAVKQRWFDEEGVPNLDDIEQEVSTHIAREVRLPCADVTARPLTELGLDSLLTMAIRRTLERSFNLRLPARMLREQRTTADVAQRVAELMVPASSTA